MRRILVIMIAVLTSCIISTVLATGAELVFHQLKAFEAKKGTEPIVLEYDFGVFSVEDRILHINGFGHLWTAHVSYDLTSKKRVIVETEARLHLSKEKNKKGSSLIVAFSADKRGWEGIEGSSDALTFRIGCDKTDNYGILVRTGMYSNAIKAANFIIRPEQWEKVKIELSTKRMIVHSGGVKVIDLDLSQVDFPKKGYVGLLGFRKALTEIKYLNIDTEQAIRGNR